MPLTVEEKARYGRQLMGNGFSEEKQELLKESTIMVAGIGGLGGAAVQYLVAAGVGKIMIVHAGPIELPDMNRQVLMNTRDIGRERASVAKNRLMELNPNIKIISVPEWINPYNVYDLVSKADIVMDCRHNFDERCLLNEVCIRLGKPMIEGGMDDMFGYITTIIPGKTPCLNCIFREFPEWDHLGFPVLGVIPGVLGPLMSLEVIKMVTGIGTPLLNKLLTFNGLAGEFKSLNVRRDPGCRICQIIK